jgi:hypothetical protein
MPGPTAPVELLPARRWPSRVKRSDTLRQMLQGCGRARANRTEVGGVLASREKPAFRSGYLDFDDHAVHGTHKISIAESIALSSGTFPYLSLAKTIAVIMLQQPRPPVPFDRIRPSVLRYQAQARGAIAEHKMLIGA